MNTLVDALAKALDARNTHGEVSKQYRSSLDQLQHVFNSAVEGAMQDAFRDASFISSGPFREAVLTAQDPTRIRR